MWVTILKREKSKFKSNCIVVFFEFFGVEKYSVITTKALNYFGVSDLKKGDNIYVIKSIGKNGNPFFITKMVKKNKDIGGFNYE